MSRFQPAWDFFSAYMSALCLSDYLKWLYSHNTDPKRSSASSKGHKFRIKALELSETGRITFIVEDRLGFCTMKYRSRMDILASVLQSAMKGATKTRIMYGAYLSYNQLTEYLKFLEERGLIIHDSDLQVYRLTEKSLHFLEIYEEVKQLFVDTSPSNKTRTTGPQPERISILA